MKNKVLEIPEFLLEIQNNQTINIDYKKTFKLESFFDENDKLISANNASYDKNLIKII